MNNKDSVGIVEPSLASFKDPLLLECGKELKGFELVYETYGKLNKENSNAVLICHALSGNHHAAGYHKDSEKRAGWWDSFHYRHHQCFTVINRFDHSKLGGLVICNCEV